MAVFEIHDGFSSDQTVGVAISADRQPSQVVRRHHFPGNCKNSQSTFQIAKIAKPTKIFLRRQRKENSSINPLSPTMNTKSNKLLKVHTTHLSSCQTLISRFFASSV